MTFDEFWKGEPGGTWRDEAMAQRAFSAGLSAGLARAEELARERGDRYAGDGVVYAEVTVRIARAACDEVGDAIASEIERTRGTR